MTGRLMLALGFVVLWSTGYITAGYALPDAQPMAFLAWRYGLAMIIIAVVAVLGRHQWPRRPSEYFHAAVTGISLHAFGLGSVFIAIDRSVEAGVSALIMAMQPVLTALFAAFVLRERPSLRQGVGLVLGFAGVTLVVAHRLDSGIGTVAGVAWNVVAVFAVTTGTLYQKARSQHLNPFTGTAIQFAAATLACVLLSALFQEEESRWTPQVLGALAWATVALSVVATSVLYWMIRRGAMAVVASLFYLVPLSTATMAWILFDERITGISLVGMCVTIVGVAMVSRANQQ